MNIFSSSNPKSKKKKDDSIDIRHLINNINKEDENSDNKDEENPENLRSNDSPTKFNKLHIDTRVDTKKPTSKNYLRKAFELMCYPCLKCISYLKEEIIFILKSPQLSALLKRKKKVVLAQPSHLKGRKTLALDLDETLVHSSFKEIPHDFSINVVVGNSNFQIFVKKRPGLDEFIEKMGKIFEIAIYTSSMEEYADPLISIIDPKKLINIRLYRENCGMFERKVIKTLDELNRDLKNVIFIDNTESAFSLHKQNSILIKSYFDDDQDIELLKLIPILTHLSTLPDVRPVADKILKFVSQNNNPKISPTNTDSSDKFITEKFDFIETPKGEKTPILLKKMKIDDFEI